MKKYSLVLRRVIFAYTKSMRPYLFFISGMAGWLGVVFSGTTSSITKIITVISVVFIGWGVNQVINDLLGLKADKINAPHRPLISGELSIKEAIAISLFFFILGGIITYFLNPQAIILFLLVFMLNIIYEYSKKVPFLGNIVFGFLLAPCVYYGAMCINNKGLWDVLLDKRLGLIAIAVILVNITVAFFTYYKDYIGDKAGGRRTIIVQLSPYRARYLNYLMSAVPFTVLIFLPIWRISINVYFIVLIALTFLMLQYTAFLFFRNPQGVSTYYSLKWNFRGAVLFKTSFIALVNPLLAGILYLINFILVGFLFELHKDHLA